MALAEQQGVQLDQLGVKDWQSLSPDFGDDIGQVFQFERSAASRDAAGGTSPRAIRVQIRQAKARLRNHYARLKAGVSSG